MTTPVITTCCWELGLPGTEPEDTPFVDEWVTTHYASEADALQAWESLVDTVGDVSPRVRLLAPVQVANPCVEVHCRLCARALADQGDDAPVTHYPSEALARQEARSVGWTQDLVCPDHQEFGVMLMPEGTVLANMVTPSALPWIARESARASGGLLVRRINGGRWEVLEDLLSYRHGTETQFAGTVVGMVRRDYGGELGAMVDLETADGGVAVHVLPHIYQRFGERLAKGNLIGVGGLVHRGDPDQYLEALWITEPK